MRAVHLATIVAAFAVFASPVHAETSITLVNPTRYTDATTNGATGIKAYLERLGATLTPGLALRITVLDVDMAGRSLFRSDSEFRIVRGSTWPSVRLRYVLSKGQRVIASGEERIDDTLYLMDASQRGSVDPLRYEKAVLRDWFESRFRIYQRKSGG